MTSAGDMYTRFPRHEHRAVLLGLRGAQVALLAAAVLIGAVAVLGGAALAARAALAAVATALAVTATLRAESMPLYRWLLLRLVHFGRRRARQHSYRARPLTPPKPTKPPRPVNPPKSPKAPKASKAIRPSEEGRLRLPGTHHALRVLHRPGTYSTNHAGMGVVYDPVRKRLTAVGRVSSPAHLLQNTAEQDRRVAEYGRLIAGLCRGGRIARAQIIERTLPDSGDELATWARQRGLDPTTTPGAIYTHLLQHAAPASARHETLIGLTLDLAAINRDTRKHGGGLAGAVAVLESEARVFQSTLTAAGVDGHWLSAQQIASAIRLAFDPTAVRAIDQLGGQLPPSAAGPMAVDSEWDHLRTDSSFHRVYQIDEWPRINVGPGFLSPLLLKPGIRRTFSIVLQPIPITKALKDARRDQVERITDRATRNKVGQLETEQDRQVDHDIAQRERDLATGHGDIRWVGLLVVSADRLDLLEDASAHIEVAASQSLLDLRTLVGQQAEAFTAAVLPFGTALE